MAYCDVVEQYQPVYPGVVSNSTAYISCFTFVLLRLATILLKLLNPAFCVLPELLLPFYFLPVLVHMKILPKLPCLYGLPVPSGKDC